jgi:DNA polymerase-1
MHPLHSNNLDGATYLAGRWCCFDFETTNTDYGTALNPENRIVTVSWQSGRGKHCGDVHVHDGNPLECPEFWKALDAADFWIAQNCKFEAHWLWRMGVDPTNKLWADPMLFEWVRLGNNPDNLRKDLDSLAERYHVARKDERIAAMMDGGVCPSQWPRKLREKRAKRDVRTTAQIARKQIRLLEKEETLGCAVTRCLLAPILVDMERNGMYLDAERVEETYAEYKAEYHKVKQEFDDFTGGVNPRSPDQMAHYLYGGGMMVDPEDKDNMIPNPAPNLGFPLPRRLNKASKQFPEGRPPTDQNTLERLAREATTKKQRRFIELRQEVGRLNAALTKNLEFFVGVVRERGGHFHTEIRQGTTGTHRLSGGGMPLQFDMFPKKKSVQSQNMPRIFKRLFCARDGYLYEEADGMQLEFRVAMHNGDDQQMLADIEDPAFDAHKQTACVLNNIGDPAARDYEGVDHTMRQNAKADTFKPLYGGEKGTPEQEAYYQWFQKRYSGFYDTGMWNLDTVEATGKLVTETGLTFRWDTKMNERNQVLMDKRRHRPVKPSVFNYPTQYLATGEIVPIAIIHLYYRVKKAGLRVLFNNTVHDSIGAEVHVEDHEAYRDLVVQAFTKDVYNYLRRVYGIKFKAPLGVEIKAGAYWGEGEEFSVTVPRGD